MYCFIKLTEKRTLSGNRGGPRKSDSPIRFPGYRFGVGHHDLSVFVRNPGDTEKNIYTIDFNNLTGIVNEPRTWGVEYAWRY